VVICMTFGMPAGRHTPRGRKPVKDFIFLNRHGSSFISGAE